MLVLGFLATLCPLTLVNGSPIAKRAPSGPVIESDFPDPSIVEIGGTWYAFGTQSVYDQPNIKIQLATSPDFTTWTLSSGHDALRTLPPWVDSSNPKVWAPEVIQIDDGSFLMYFSATTNAAGNGRYHCVGTATSDSIAGPYDSNTDEPFACPTAQGGAIDAASFKDTDGARYVMYKIDAVALGNTCAAPEGTSTDILVQRVEEDGFTKLGAPMTILSNGEYDGGNVEAPVMTKTEDGVYVLFFSSNCYTSEAYDTSYATSESPMGPFKKTQFPLLVTGEGIWGPGGASVAIGGREMAFHGYESEDAVGGRRFMYVARPAYDGDRVSV
ncbi:hypothetical protein MBLNU230_g5801t1 [Neophaeotheca triangularis]